MSTNDTEEETVVSEDAVTELATAVAEAEDTKPEAEETEEPAPNAEEPAEAEETKEQSEEPEATFTKLVPSIGGDTLEEHAALVAKAYSESTKEALRLKSELDKQKPVVQSEAEVTLTPEQLYIKQKQDEEVAEALTEIAQNYSQIKDKSENDRFVAMAQTVGKNIVDAEGRLPSPKEVYAKTVVLLGWATDDSQDKLSSALKGSAASQKTSSGTPTPPQQSKVTEAMIKHELRVFPDKTRQEIIKELEPYVQ